MSKVRNKAEQIEEFLLTELQKRKYKAHDKLPSETKLCQTFEVSRVTARRCLHDLAEKGFIYSVKGCGSFVSEKASELLYNAPQNNSLKKIGIVFPHKIDFFKNLYLALQTEFTRSNFSHRFFFSTSIQEEKEAFQFFIRNKYDAIILSPNREYFDNNFRNFELLNRNKIPYVIIGKPPDNIFCNAVYYDDIAGCIALVRELYFRKCKQIIHITSLYCDQEAVKERREGYLYGMKKFYPDSEKRIFNINQENFQKDLSDFVRSFRGKLGIILHDNAEYMTVRNILDAAPCPYERMVVGFNAPPDVAGKEHISSIEHNIAYLAQKSVDLLSIRFFSRNSDEEITHSILKPQILLR